MSRTIVKTETPGWFQDPATGKKTRKKDGDTILTLDEFKALSEKPAKTKTVAELREGAIEAGKDQPLVTLTTGKTGRGKMTTIRCAWVDVANRTPAQKTLFEGDPSKITYDNVVKAAGTTKSAMPDGRERVIKVQDAFQVRFYPENQKKWRSELLRRKNRARREAAKAAAGKS